MHNEKLLKKKNSAMSLIVCAGLTVFMLLSGCAGNLQINTENGGAGGLDAKIAELGAELLRDSVIDRKLTIVVVPFMDLQCQSPDFGKYISEGLIANLGKSRQYSIVERELLYKILEEQKLGLLGIMDDASATKIGKILGVDRIITGTFSVLDSRVKLNGRMISPETGLIISVAETNVAKNKEVEALLRTSGQPPQPPAGKSSGKWAKTEVHVPGKPTPVYGKDYYAEQNARLRKDAVPVDISIRGAHFLPVIFGVSANWNDCPVRLTTDRPRGVTREPVYQGASRRYGFIRLGNTDNNVFFFALDLVNGPHPVLYLDRNQNGDLTDDGGPIVNQGEKGGVFSTEITLPFDRILKGARFPEDYKAWFFTNETYWQRDVMCIYSKSQLKGKVVLDGVEYLAYLADSGANDATFTSKGIYLDVNRNGKIDGRSEFFEPDSVAEVQNRRYEFKITW